MSTSPRILSDVRRPRHRGNGEGSVVQRPGRWDAVVVTGWTLDGRPVRRSRSASSEAAAKALLAEMVRARESGDPIPDDQITVGAFLRTWLRRSDLGRRSTVRLNRLVLGRYVLPAVGSVRLRHLRASHVSSLLVELSDRGLAGGTVGQVRSVLARALADAERDRLIDHNPARLARAPRGEASRRRTPDAADVRAVLEELGPHRIAGLYVLAASTGLRLGEATGLRWADIDGSRLTVNVQLQPTHDPLEPYVLTEPKTPSSHRTIELAPVAIDALRRQKARQATEQLAAGRKWRDRSDLVFTTIEGEPLAPSSVNWILQQACDRAAVERFSFHAFRRFAATVVGDTRDMKAAQALLGHRSETLTANVYAAKTDDAMHRAAVAMQEALGG